MQILRDPEYCHLFILKILSKECTNFLYDTCFLGNPRKQNLWSINCLIRTNTVR